MQVFERGGVARFGVDAVQSGYMESADQWTCDVATHRNSSSGTQIGGMENADVHNCARLDWPVRDGVPRA